MWLIKELINGKGRQANRDRINLRNLYFYHLLLSIVYYIYALYNPSDSKHYYNKVVEYFRGPGWSDFYGTSTTFIEWTGYPFIHYLRFTYEAMMVLFSFLGFLGLALFYKLFRERIFLKKEFLGTNLFMLFFLLPNLHFWSGSYGKGSFIFLGISLIFYGLNNIRKRWVLLFIGGVLTYHIRPHIMLVILFSTILGFSFSVKGLSIWLKTLMLTVSIGAFVLIYQDVLLLIGIEQGEELSQGLDLSKRAFELSKATSGIDISQYSILQLLFTFLYRPLFFDAPGMLGIIVSFENVFLLIITIYFIGKGGGWYLVKSDFLVKTAFLSFITVSIALAQISGNLGIAMRQKSQVMILFLFVILCFFNDRELIKRKQRWLKKELRNVQQLGSIKPKDDDW